MNGNYNNGFDVCGQCGAAFKIINNNEYPFNFINSKLQVLKPERIKEFEQLYNDVIRIQKINDFEVYKNYYIFPLSAIRDYN